LTLVTNLLTTKSSQVAFSKSSNNRTSDMHTYTW